MTSDFPGCFLSLGFPLRVNRASFLCYPSSSAPCSWPNRRDCVATFDFPPPGFSFASEPTGHLSSVMIFYELARAVRLHNSRCLRLPEANSCLQPADGCARCPMPDARLQAFKACTSLAAIVIPDSVTTLGSYIFSECHSLTSIVLSDSLQLINANAFKGCRSLESIVIPNSVITLQNWAFEGCSRLVAVVIPDSVTTIGSGTFLSCTSLNSATIPTGVDIQAGAFSNCACPEALYVPGATISSCSATYRYAVPTTSPASAPTAAPTSPASSSDSGGDSEDALALVAILGVVCGVLGGVLIAVAVMLYIKRGRSQSAYVNNLHVIYTFGPLTLPPRPALFLLLLFSNAPWGLPFWAPMLI